MAEQDRAEQSPSLDELYQRAVAHNPRIADYYEGRIAPPPPEETNRQLTGLAVEAGTAVPERGARRTEAKVCKAFASRKLPSNFIDQAVRDWQSIKRGRGRLSRVPLNFGWRSPLIIRLLLDPHPG
jgi:hypothetical protein